MLLLAEDITLLLMADRVQHQSNTMLLVVLRNPAYSSG
jgi:hypothetical protein